MKSNKTMITWWEISSGVSGYLFGQYTGAHWYSFMIFGLGLIIGKLLSGILRGSDEQ